MALQQLPPRTKARFDLLRATGVRRLPRRRGRVVVALAGLVFFFTPLLALALGARAKPIENHPLAAAPSLTDGWQIFPELARWAEDRMPLRDEAVRLNTQVSTGLFGEVPAYGGHTSPQVILGKSGWLYFADDWDLACHPANSTSQMIAGVDRLADMVHRLGKQFYFYVPPDKTAVETSYLPSSAPNEGCGRASQQSFWRRMAAAPPAGYVDLYGPLRRLRASTGQPVYKQKDTHWAPRGAAVFVSDLVNRIDPALMRTTAFTLAGTGSMQGDLTPMLGVPSNDHYPNWTFKRQGVTRTQPRVGEIRGIWERGAVTTSAPLYQPNVLFICDSFTRQARPLLEPFFAHWTQADLSAMAARPDVLARMIMKSPVVVFEVAERTFATGRAALLRPATLDALQNSIDHELYEAGR